MRILVVTAKNFRTGCLETHRWSDPHITRDTAIAQMGYWLTQLGWHYKEIRILSAGWQIEDKQTGMIRMRLVGEKA